MNLEETLIKSEEIYSGRVVRVTIDTVRLPNGKESTREIVHHNGACAILPITNEGKIVLVKQYRCSLSKVLYEIPAGKLEKGEDPKECAFRELEEETGYKAKNMEEYLMIYPAAGYSGEALYIYKATDFIKTQLNLDEDEFVEVVEMDVKKLKDMVMNNEINDSKTVSAVLKYCLENNI